MQPIKQATTQTAALTAALTTALACVLPLLTGCVSVQEQVAAAPTLSSYTLCEAVVVNLNAAPVVREAWARELHRRGENCRQHLPTIQARMQARATAEAEHQKRLEDIDRYLAAQKAQQAAQQAANPPPQQATAFYKRDYISGVNRICVYDRLGSQYVVTIAVTQICPLTQ